MNLSLKHLASILEALSYGQTSQNVVTLPLTECWFAERSVNPYLDKVVHIVG